MRLKRKMTEAEFADAVQKMTRPPNEESLAIAHADLVRGIPQAQIAKEYGIDKSNVSQAAKRVWKGFLKSKGFQEITVVLPKFRVFTVQNWQQEALQEINRPG